jgi:hypothetical protein
MAGPQAEKGPQIKMPAPTVEVIAETRKSTSRPRFGEQASPLEGVRFLVEPGGMVDFNRRQTRQIQADGDRIARSKRYKKTADAAKGRWVKLKADQSAFAGVVSERGNYRSPLYDKEQKVVYDAALLEASTGEFHLQLVREEGRLTIALPAREGVNAREELAEFAQAVARLMVESGRDPDEVGKLVTPTIVQRLDEQKLFALMAEDKVQLEPGTRKVTIAWEVPTDPLKPDIKPKPQRLVPKSA